jgi:hypothetical protein
LVVHLLGRVQVSRVLRQAQISGDPRYIGRPDPLMLERGDRKGQSRSSFVNVPGEQLGLCQCRCEEAYQHGRVCLVGTDGGAKLGQAIFERPRLGARPAPIIRPMA